MEHRQQHMHPDFKKWFPRLVPKDFQPDPLMRLFCFHGAGMDFTVWTTLGSPRAPMPNSLASLCEKENLQLLAAQLPGRGVRSKDALPPTLQACAAEILEVIEPLICSRVPYVLIGYSMGSWLAYELCCAINKRRQEKKHIRLPEIVIVASMVSPNIPQTKRPWDVTSNLSHDAFQRELRGWSCNEVLFQPDLWESYEPMLRRDHKLLDDYMCTMPDKRLDVPCTVFRARDDLKLQTDALFDGWFFLFNKKNYPAQQSAAASCNSRIPAMAVEDDGKLSREFSPIKNTICLSEIIPDLLKLQINHTRSNSEAETSGSGRILPEARKQTEPPPGARDTVMCSSPLTSEEKKNVETNGQPPVHTSAEQKDQTTALHVKLLEGNHGLMYDSRYRDLFFIEIEKLLEPHILEITYSGA